jgi:hypothetical protein
MKQKTGGALVLCIALLMSACGENPVIDDGNNTREGEERVPAANASEHKDGGEYIAVEGKDGNTVPTTPPVQEPGQEIRGMEPFDIDVFNAHRAVWEKDPVLAYVFTQTHSGPGMDISVTIEVNEDDIPENLPDRNEPEPVLFCGTISELYEKIAALWTEQRYTADSFLIKYDGEPVLQGDDPAIYHYPTDIQIRNMDNSGRDYNAWIHIDKILLPPWGQGDDAEAGNKEPQLRPEWWGGGEWGAVIIGVPPWLKAVNKEP